MRSSDALVRTISDAARLPLDIVETPPTSATPAPLRLDPVRVAGPRVSVVIVAAGDSGTSAEHAAHLLTECTRLQAQVVLVLDGSRRGPALSRGTAVRHVVAPAGASAVEYRRLGAQHADGDVVFVVEGDGQLTLERVERLAARRHCAD